LHFTDLGFHPCHLAPGFLLWGPGVLIAYLIDDDYKQNRVKWARIGVAVATVLWVILWIAVFTAATATI